MLPPHDDSRFWKNQLSIQVFQNAQLLFCLSFGICGEMLITQTYYLANLFSDVTKDPVSSNYQEGTHKPVLFTY